MLKKFIDQFFCATVDRPVGLSSEALEYCHSDWYDRYEFWLRLAEMQSVELKRQKEADRRKRHMKAVRRVLEAHNAYL